MRPRGAGCVRRVKGSRFWHIYYYCNGRQIRESSKSESKAAAERLLHRRFSEMGIAFRHAANPPKAKYEDIRQLLLEEYRRQRHRSLTVAEDGTETVSGLKRLDAFFAGRRVASITTDVLRTFVREGKWNDKGRKFPVSNVTMNRNLALLRRMMNLARREGKIHFVPYFPVLAEKPRRKGFFKREEFEKLRKELPERLRPLITFLYLTGCRLGEAKAFRVSEVDFQALEIRPEGARTTDSPRVVPLDGLEQFVEELRLRQDSSEDSLHDHVFCATNLPKAWRRACIRLGLGRIESLPHGREVYRGFLVQHLRRSAVRNMIEAGVEEKVAMEISGYKQRETFDPYNVFNASKVHEAIKKVLEKTGSTAAEE